MLCSQGTVQSGRRSGVHLPHSRLRQRRPLLRVPGGMAMGYGRSAVSQCLMATGDFLSFGEIPRERQESVCLFPRIIGDEENPWAQDS